VNRSSRVSRSPGSPSCFFLCLLIALLWVGCVTKPDNRAPVASFTVEPAIGTPDTLFVFDARGSNDPDCDNRFLQIRWDWDADGNWDTLWGTIKVRHHRFPTDGTMTICMEVRDPWTATSSTNVEILVVSEPVARFTITPESGIVGDLFTFDASGSAHPRCPADSLHVRWDLDGDEVWEIEWTREKVTTYVYPVAGPYTVVLEVREPHGWSARTERTLIVLPENDPPEAFFTVSPDSGDIATLFTFDATGSSDPQDALEKLRFSWDWEGDGVWDRVRVSEPVGTHIYLEPGEYEPRLQVKDPLGAITSTTGDTIRVTNAPPVAAFTSSVDTAAVHTLFTFDASASTDPEYPDQIEYHWDFNGDGTWDSMWSGETQIDYEYIVGGTYTVTLEIRDSCGLTDQAQHDLVLQNTPPAAAFTISPTSGDGNTDFTFDASPTTDTESSGDQIQVRWDWENNGIWDCDWTTEKTAARQFAGARDHTIVLQVRDDGGETGQTSRILTVDNTLPEPAFTWSPAKVTINEPVSFDASTSTDLEDGTGGLECRWDWEGDGVWDGAYSSEMTATYSYPEPGYFQVRLEVRDSHGGVADTSHVISISPAILWNSGGPATNSCAAIGPDGSFYVCFGSVASGGVRALNPDGSLQWEYAVDGVVRGSPAVADDGTIYFGSDNWFLYALNPDGTQKWWFLADDAIRSTPAIGSDGTVYVKSSDQYLYALTPDGDTLWDFFLGSGGSAPAVGPDSTIYTTAGSNRLLAITPQGSEKWTYYAAARILCSPAIGDDGTLYFGDEQNTLYAVNTDGSLQWTYSIGSPVVASPVLAVDGTVYVGLRDLHFYAISPAGELCWKVNLGMQIESTAAVGADGTIFIPTDVLWALNPSGNRKWVLNPDDVVLSASPTIGSDGTLYLGAGSGGFYAVPTDCGGLAPSAWPKLHSDIRNTGRRH